MFFDNRGEDRGGQALNIRLRGKYQALLSTEADWRKDWKG